MKKIILSAAIVVGMAGAGLSQSTTDRTNRKGDTIQTTRSGTGQVSKSITGPGGKTATVNKSVNMQGGTGTIDKTVTGPNGRTSTVDKNVNMNHGVGSVSSTITGPNGKTAVRNTAVGPNAVRTTTTGPNGGVKTTAHRRGRLK